MQQFPQKNTSSDRKSQVYEANTVNESTLGGKLVTNNEAPHPVDSKNTRNTEIEP